jgi:hypothetical protein
MERCRGSGVCALAAVDMLGEVFLRSYRKALEKGRQLMGRDSSEPRSLKKEVSVRRLILLIATMALAILIASGVAQAIINGEPDGNMHPYVGRW